MRICLKCNQLFASDCWHCPVCDWRSQSIRGFPALAPEFALGVGGFKPEYFAELACLEANSFWFRSRSRLIIWAIQHYFSKIESFFEVGCGTGFVLSGIAAAKLTCVWREVKFSLKELDSRQNDYQMWNLCKWMPATSHTYPSSTLSGPSMYWSISPKTRLFCRR
jgi:hypothetical protein